ncbi:MAG: DUF935 domain-containing protein, partial [Sphingomonadales bacterium]|nr:DUF935 domain-containing protein [Sphingomonadales bacterium]
MPATIPPPLVWANGQPMRTDVLTREIAGPQLAGVRSIVSGHPAQGLTPQRLARLLRSAEHGDATAYLELAEEMEEKDLHYLSVLGTRKRQVSQLPIEVVPADDSEEAKGDAQLIRDWLERDLIQAELFDILDAVGKGYSATEIVWEFTDTTWLPVRLKYRDPRFFEFHRTDGETLLLRDLEGPVPIPAYKFIVHYHQAKSGLPIRGGLARAVAWLYMFKNYAIKDWVAFLETYGMPLRIGRYDNGETDENIGKLLAALSDLGSDAAAAIPKSMAVEFVDGKAGTAPKDLWLAKAEFADNQISKAVLGQTGTTDTKSGGIGDGGNKVHNDVRGDIERADAVAVAATLNEQLVRPIVMFNRGPRRRYPRLRIGRPDAVDVKGMTEAATALVGLGAQVDADEVRDRAGLPAPKAGGRVLTAAPTGPVAMPGAPVGAGSAATSLFAPLSGPHGGVRVLSQIGTAASASNIAPIDPVDAAVEASLADWEALMTPVIDPVRS